MKFQMTGDRNWDSYEAIRMTFLALAATVDDGTQITLIHGDARGADRMSGEIADCMDWKVISMPADWEKYGRAAGPIRNNEMLDMEPQFLVAFHDDLASSKGTKHCVKEALRRGIDVILVNSKGELLAIPEDL